MPRGSRHACWEMAAASGAVVTPDQVSAVSAWLRVANATTSGGTISSVPDQLNSNPAAQAVTARQPATATSNNGLPCMLFATNCVLVWPITAQSSASNQAGWGLWLKLTAASGTQRVMRMSTGTNGANGLKLNLSTIGTGTSESASPDGTTFKTDSPSTPTVLDTGWHFLTLEYDKDGAADTDKFTVTIDDVVQTNNISGSATLGALFGATGNILIGNGNDGTASSPLGGTIGPNIYAFGSKMTGATTGLLTAAARNSLMNFDRPN